MFIFSRVKVERPLMMKWQLGRQKAVRNIVIEVVRILRILMNKKNRVGILLQCLRVLPKVLLNRYFLCCKKYIHDKKMLLWLKLQML